jgi:hypothetical protein
MLLMVGNRMIRWTRRRGARLPLTSVPLFIALFTCLTGFDLTRHSVPLGQILNGGPPKDGIPAILQPKLVGASDASFLMPDDRVIGVFVHGKARAYPLKILNWHEVVDDSVGGKPLAVTFCPLTQSAIVYDRDLGEKPLTLGVSGKLYESNLLFYDKATESLWSQIKGQAVAGPLTGRRLEPLPSIVTPRGQFGATRILIRSCSTSTPATRVTTELIPTRATKAPTQSCSRSRRPTIVCPPRSACLA